jgi:RNA-dependent RNA polymerase
VIILQPDIARHFTSSKFIQPPKDFLDKYFDKKSERVEQFIQKTPQSVQGNSDLLRNYYQDQLLAGLDEPPRGIYSVFHENAVYVKGYDDPEAERLGFM